MLPTQVRHKRILVVEDNFVLSETLSTLLGADGYMVWTCSDGQEAMDRLRGKEKPDLILLDLVMPGKDGFTFLRERGAHPEMASIPVVLVSGATDLEQQMAALGAADCLPKPVDCTDLLLTVRRYLG